MNDDDNLRSVDGLASGKESQCSVSDWSVKDRTVVGLPVFRDFVTDHMLR
jgi:hypothetical protein